MALTQGHMTEKREIYEAAYVDHHMDLYVGPSSQSFLYLLHSSLLQQNLPGVLCAAEFTTF